MKKIIMIAAVLLCGVFSATAQNYMVVNSEKIFKSITAYTEAMTSIETLSKQYQQNIDNAFAEIEKMYNDYQAQKAYLSTSARQSREDEIINREKEVNEYQKQVFGQDGDLMKKRIELLKPIQDKVFEIINKYAQDNGFTLVLDIAASPMVLYYAPALDKTEAIIPLVK